MAAALPGTRLVYVADREADLVEPMRLAHNLPKEVLQRFYIHNIAAFNDVMLSF